MVAVPSTLGSLLPFLPGRPVVVLSDTTAQGRQARLRAQMIANDLGVRLDLVPADAGPTRLSERSAHAALLVLPYRSGNALAECFLGTPPERAARALAIPTLAVARPAGGAYRRVLVPVKLDEGAAFLIDTARVVAAEARIRVLHVLDRRPESSLWLADAPELDIRAQRRRRASMARAALDREIAVAGAASRGASMVAFGHVAMRVLESARTGRTQLVVVGQRSRSLIDQLLAGSTTTRVVGAGASDVLVVPMRGRPDGTGMPTPSRHTAPPPLHPPASQS